MTLRSLSFFVPVKYPYPYPTLIQFVDAYFDLGGRVALVELSKVQGGREGVRLQADKAIPWSIILKVMSYSAPLLNYLIAARVPALSKIKGAIHLQMALSWLPGIMAIAKIMLRSIYGFYIIEEKREVPKAEDLVSDEVKVTLDKLFGGPGSFDQLPFYEKDDSPKLGTMSAPIMRGVTKNPKNNQANPFIAIKVQRVKKAEGLDFLFPDGALVIYPLYLLGKQMEVPALPDQALSSLVNGPIFFPNAARDGRDFTDAAEGFRLLQALIRDGKGKDTKGVEWEIIGHSIGGDPKVSTKSDLIPDEVKATLDELFGGPGSVDRLPLYTQDDSPTVEKMSEPVMKGIITNPKNGHSNPFIAIKMRCLTKIEELRSIYPRVNFAYYPDPIEEVSFLAPMFVESLCAWVEVDSLNIVPVFFYKSWLEEGNFTYEKNGKVTESQRENFERLKTLLREGKGKDQKGVEWEVIGYSKEKQ